MVAEAVEGRVARQVVPLEPVRPVDLQQLDEIAAGKLRQPVRRAHAVLMHGARGEREAEALPDGRCAVEVAHGEHDVVDGAAGRHQPNALMSFVSVLSNTRSGTKKSAASGPLAPGA